MIPTSAFLYLHIRRITYTKEKAMKIWEERIEAFRNNDTVLQEKVIRK